MLRVGQQLAGLPRAIGRCTHCLARDHMLRELRHGDLLFASHPPDAKQELNRAMRAVGEKTISWLEEHGVHAPGHEVAEHVGLVVADSMGCPRSVVEAVHVVGVRVQPVDAFLRAFSPGTRFFHGQLRGATQVQRRHAVSFAVRRIGAPFAEDYAPPDPLCVEPWTQAFYCSSLVDYAYREALGESLVFSNEPFPLTWAPERFWKLFHRQQGLVCHVGFGSNPTLLLHSPRVTFAGLQNGDPPREEVHELF
mmetsp:Transcript_11080/g.26027  ORF Transcript_11080/g.26027 Transcript_11080/m.26027 type:complete len:251 (+) Transcript_11080:36-788(+)